MGRRKREGEEEKAFSVKWSDLRDTFCHVANEALARSVMFCHCYTSQCSNIRGLQLSYYSSAHRESLLHSFSATVEYLRDLAEKLNVTRLCLFLTSPDFKKALTKLLNQPGMNPFNWPIAPYILCWPTSRLVSPHLLRGLDARPMTVNKTEKIPALQSVF